MRSGNWFRQRPPHWRYALQGQMQTQTQRCRCRTETEPHNHSISYSNRSLSWSQYVYSYIDHHVCLPACLLTLNVPTTLLCCSSTNTNGYCSRGIQCPEQGSNIWDQTSISEPSRTAAGSLTAELAALCPVSGPMSSRYHHLQYLLSRYACW